MHQGGVVVLSSPKLGSPKKEEEVPPYNPKLRSPKKEEDEQVVEEMMISADGQTDIMEEIESIFGIADEQKSEDNMFAGSEWDFMEFEGLSRGEEEKEERGEQYNKRLKMEDQFLLEECDDHNHVSVVVKRENLGFWEEEKTISLNLNYQEVLDAWSDGRSPWADDYSLSTANEVFIGEVPIMEEEKRRREARVMRYKEKRQSRLFSKKIRYQVRKLNAEKRPRLKGRFVKRIPDKMLR